MNISQENTKYPNDILKAYLYGDNTYIFNRYNQQTVPYIFTTLSNKGLIEDDIIYAGVYLYLENLKIAIKNNSSVEDKNKQKNIQDKRRKLLDLIKKVHFSEEFKEEIKYKTLTDEEKKFLKEIKKESEKLKKFLKERSNKIKDKEGKILTNAILDKKNLDIYNAEITSNTNPDFIFLGFLADIENEDDRYSFVEKVSKFSNLIHKTYYDYMQELMESLGDNDYTKQWLLKHALPFRDNFIAAISDKILYGLSLANIKKKYNEEDIKKQLWERLSKIYENEDKELLKEEAIYLFETFFKKPYEFTKEYHETYFDEVFKRFNAFYKENFGKDVPEKIIYEKYKITSKKDFSVESIIFYPEYSFEGIILVSNDKDKEKFKNLIKKYINSIRRFSSEFTEAFEKSLKDVYFVSWNDLLVYYQYYQNNEKFQKYLINKGNSIIFLFDIFFAVSSIYIFSKLGKKFRVPFFLVYDTQEDKTVNFYNFFNAFLYSLSEFPFQSIRYENFKQDIKMPFINSAKAKNTFLSLLKNKKKLTFKIKTDKKIGYKQGIIIKEESSNNIFKYFDEEEKYPEIDRKHRILHFYKFEYKDNNISIKYISNAVKLSNQPIEIDFRQKIDEDTYVISVCDRLSKEEIEYILQEGFGFSIKPERFCYIRYIQDIPFIRVLKQRNSKNKNAEGIFINRQYMGDILRNAFNYILDDPNEIGNVFTIIYSPKNDDLKYISTFAETYLVYHNEELKDIIEKILLSISIYSSESYFIPYSKPKKILPKNSKMYFERLNNKYASFESVIIPEMLFMFKRLFKEV